MKFLDTVSHLNILTFLVYDFKKKVFEYDYTKNILTLRIYFIWFTFNFYGPQKNLQP